MEEPDYEQILDEVITVIQEVQHIVSRWEAEALPGHRMFTEDIQRSLNKIIAPY